MSDGLSHSEIQCIGQDTYGFMWIGTNYGLNIYDGNDFSHYHSDENDNKTLPGNSISALVFRNDSVWIGTRSGLCLMDIISKKCTQIDIGVHTDVRTLSLDKEEQTLWIGTSTGLLKYDTGKGTFQEFNTSNSNISHDIVRALYKDRDGNLWVGTFDKLNMLTRNSNVFRTIDLKEDYSPWIKNNLALSILPVNAGNDSLLWIGTGTGLVLFNRYTNSMQFFREENSNLPNNVVKAISLSKSGKVWIGTDFGLAEINESFEIASHHHDPFRPNSLANSIVWDIFEDNSGALWFGTNNGLSILSKTSNRFHFYPMAFTRGNNIAGYEIRDVLVDSKEDYWLATQFGVLHYNPEKELFHVFNSEQSEKRKLGINDTRGLLEDRFGRIWIASNGGVAIWDPKHEKLKKYTASFNSNSGLRTNYITNFQQYKEGTILVNTYDGLHKAIENNGEFKFEYLGNTPIDNVGDTYLWSYGTSNLLRIDPTSFEQESVLEISENNAGSQVNTVSIIEDSVIWMGIENGLLRYELNSDEYQSFKIKSNKSFPIINLLPDNEGNIWATSYAAIIKFSTDKEDFDIFPSGDEIQMDGFIANSNYKCKNGDIIFGGHDGFIRFSPNELTKSDFNPPVRVTKLFVSNQEISSEKQFNGRAILNLPISFTDNIELDYSERSFSLEFSSLQFGSRNGIRYAYKLGGTDSDWNFINEDRGSAHFSNLKPGSYSFTLKGTNNDGVWNENETRLSIHIKPPFWASPSMIVLYTTLFILMAWALIYYLSFRAKMKNQLNIAYLEKEHSENLAKARQQFFTNISHEFRTPLSLIIGPIEKLSQASKIDSSSKNFVQLIENNARRLLWLNNQLLDFRKLENKSLHLQISEFGIIQFARKVFTLFTDKAERKHIEYTFSSDFEQLKVKMDLRKIETILFNLLSNAFKFTPENGQISMSIYSGNFNAGDGLCISIKDSGMGIAEEDQKKIFERFYQTPESMKLQRGSGIGLTLVNEYVQMHQGKIELKSQPGQGSEFNVILPLNAIPDVEEKELVELENDELLAQSINKANIETQLLSSVSGSVSGNPLVLLVEDDVEIANFVRVSLSEHYNVQHAINGKDALQLISKQLPDIIVSDIIMPEMNGIELTKKIKQNPKTAHIPLILLTGQSETECQLKGLQSGADAYITKPFNIELLEVRIKNFLKGRIQLTEYLKRESITNPKEIKLTSQDEKLLRRVVTCIEKHISDPDLNIEKVCAEIGLSHSILYRKIKSLTGKTVNEFIRTVRIRRAEQLLRTRKFSVSEIVYESGFSNHSYFTKTFRKEYKMTPREYMDQF